MNQYDKIFIDFQIMKFDKKRIVPAVTMSININVTRLISLKKELNSLVSENNRITITHLVIKAVADTLVNYQVLYSLFNGSEIVYSKELVLNIPVDIGNHVEYIIIHEPHKKSLSEIADKCQDELKKIHKGDGEFINYLQKINKIPSWLRYLSLMLPNTSIAFLRYHYGNFSISNFGSFNIDNGSLAISQPMIASLCICKISQMTVPAESETSMSYMNLPLTIVFDHRAVDGAYVGRFLNEIKCLLESPDKLLQSKKGQVSVHL